MAQAEKEKTFQEQADEYGRRVVAGMREELDALTHAAECDGTDGAGDDCYEGNDSECPAAWHNEDQAREWIQNSPLSVEVRSGWYAPGGEPGVPEEFCILLGTGGPASRIIGELSEHGEPESAKFQYQDWGTPWTPARLSGEEDDTLLEWARVFYFGEGS